MADTFGLVIDDVDGSPILRVTDRITRIMGVANTGKVPGNIQIPVSGTVWYFAYPINPYLADGEQPVFTVNGRNLSWTWAYLPGNRASLQFTYGVY